MKNKVEELSEYLSENDADDVEANSVNMSDNEEEEEEEGSAPFASQQWPQSFRF